MLFVAPKAFRKGVGKALLKEALERYLGAFEVIKVNSLEWALGFYQALGFAKTGKKPIPAGSTGAFSPELIPLNITRESLTKVLWGLRERVRGCVALGLPIRTRRRVSSMRTITTTNGVCHSTRIRSFLSSFC